VLSSWTNLPLDSTVRGSASNIKHFPRSELLRSLSLPRSISAFSLWPSNRPSKATLSICKCTLCLSSNSDSRRQSDILLPCQSIVRTMTLGLSAHPRSPDLSELRCRCGFLRHLLSGPSFHKTGTLRSRFSIRTWTFVVDNFFK